jgi:hypothetical protein
MIFIGPEPPRYLARSRSPVVHPALVSMGMCAVGRLEHRQYSHSSRSCTAAADEMEKPSAAPMQKSHYSFVHWCLGFMGAVK